MGYSLSKELEYTAGDLNEMTVPAIKSLASGLGYSVTKRSRADVIAQFLEEQNAREG